MLRTRKWQPRPTHLPKPALHVKSQVLRRNYIGGRGGPLSSVEVLDGGGHSRVVVASATRVSSLLFLGRRTLPRNREGRR